jgi:hypothetical protein
LRQWCVVAQTRTPPRMTENKKKETDPPLLLVMHLCAAQKMLQAPETAAKAKDELDKVDAKLLTGDNIVWFWLLRAQQLHLSSGTLHVAAQAECLQIASRADTRGTFRGRIKAFYDTTELAILAKRLYDVHNEIYPRPYYARDHVWPAPAYPGPTPQ